MKVLILGEEANSLDESLDLILKIHAIDRSRISSIEQLNLNIEYFYAMFHVIELWSIYVTNLFE